MDDVDPKDIDAVIQKIQRQAATEQIRLTAHAQQEMIEDDVVLEQLLEALSNCQILENYPDHRRGACCLVYGRTDQNRPLHIVCTTALPLLVIITVYEPKEPRWVTPTQGRGE